MLGLVAPVEEDFCAPPQLVLPLPVPEADFKLLRFLLNPLEEEDGADADDSAAFLAGAEASSLDADELLSNLNPNENDDDDFWASVAESEEEEEDDCLAPDSAAPDAEKTDVNLKRASACGTSTPVKGASIGPRSPIGCCRSSSLLLVLAAASLFLEDEEEANDEADPNRPNCFFSAALRAFSAIWSVCCS